MLAILELTEVGAGKPGSGINLWAGEGAGARLGDAGGAFTEVWAFRVGTVSARNPQWFIASGCSWTNIGLVLSATGRKTHGI